MFAVEAQQLRPDGDVVRGEREFEPRRVRLEGVKRQVRGAGRLDRLDLIFDLGVLAVADLERGDVLVVLVGDKALEPVSVQIGERELGTGVRALASADQAGAVRPLGEVDRAGQLAHPRPVALLAVTVDRRPPRRFLNRPKRLADRLGERIAQRESDPRLAAGVGEIVARASRIRPGHDVAVQRAVGELLERQVQQPEVVRGRCSRQRYPV